MYLLDQIERRVLAERQVAAMAGCDLPDVGAAKDEFLQMLGAEPERLDPAREDLLIALGLK